MNSQSKGLSMLGLAMKAGKVSSGEFATEQAVKSGNAFFLGTKSSLEEPSEENTVLPLPYVKRILQKK